MKRNRWFVAPALAVLAALTAAGGMPAVAGAAPARHAHKHEHAKSRHHHVHLKAGPKDRSETIGWLDAQVSAPIQTRYYHLAEKAAKDLGWTIDFQNINGTIAAASTDMAGLLADHVKAILTSAIEPSWITQQLAAAKAQGVPVLQIGGADGGNPSQYKSSYAGVYTENETKLAKPLGKEMHAALSHGGQWGAVLTPLIYDSTARFNEVKSMLGKAANTTLVATANVSLTDRVSTAASDIESMLEAHPNIKAIFGGLDFVTLAASEALKATHLVGKVKVYSFYTEPGNKTLMVSKPPTLTSVSDGNQAETVLVGIDQLVNNLLFKKKIHFKAKPLEPYFYKTYNAAAMKKIHNDQGPVPFKKLIAPYLSLWQHEGVLSK